MQLGMSALPPKADMCSATRDVPFGPEADITELGCHQRLDFTSLIAGSVAPLPFHRSPLSSSKPKQLGWRSSVAADIGGLRFNTTATSVFHIEWWGTLVPSITFLIFFFLQLNSNCSVSFMEAVNVMPILLGVGGRGARALIRFQFWNCKASRRTGVGPILAAWYCVALAAGH